MTFESLMASAVLNNPVFFSVFIALGDGENIVCAYDGNALDIFTAAT